MPALDPSKSTPSSSQPSSVPRSLVSPRPVAVDAPSPLPLPNIPPRTNSAQPRSLSTSLRASSSNTPKPSSSARTTPKASIDGLGRKSTPNPQVGQSALTAQLGTSLSHSPSNQSRVGGGGGGGVGGSRKASMSTARPKPPVVDSSSSSIPQIGGEDTPNPGDSNFSNIADVPDHDKLKVLRRHLVSAEERAQSISRDGTPGNISPVDNGSGEERSRSRKSSTKGNGVENGNSDEGAGVVNGESGFSRRGRDSAINGYGAVDDEEDEYAIPYDAPGTDVIHDLYKYQQNHRPSIPRSASFSHVPLDRSAILDPTLAHIREPGGFRRNFVANRAQEQGLEPPNLIRNVVDFLFLYGHFAGEDLEEDDSESDIDYLSTLQQLEEEGLPPNEIYARQATSRGVTQRGISEERRPLLNGRPSTLSRAQSKSRHKRSRSGPGQGTASFSQAVLMLLKGFVGTGILFMAKAFFNGGILFSTIVLLGIAAISLWAFLLLTSTYLVVPGSFGDIGGVLYGNWVRIAILTSITVSQIGFVAAYTIFIAENLQAFVLAVTDCKTFVPTKYMILAELVLFLPLSLIRDLAKLSGTALVADAFILIGLIYIMGNEGIVLASKGVADVALFNPTNFPLFVGTAIFTFEGIGLVIPITESMREPHKFPKALTWVMFGISILFAAAGILGYLAYGSKVQTVVIVNLPQDDKFVQAVQFLYSLAILLSTPLQLFPAVRIMENGVFSRSGKHNSKVKWQKNIFRSAIVIGCSLLSWAGSAELDKFVSLVGSFACLPLCFIYPPLLHLKACAKTRTAKFLDIGLIVFGVLVFSFTTTQTLRSLFEPSGPPPRFGKCEVPQGA